VLRLTKFNAYFQTLSLSDNDQKNYKKSKIMDLIISYIGFSQSVFAIILLLTKKPVKIAYLILGVLLFQFALTFGLDILQYYGVVEAHRWAISLSIRMLYAPLFFLYAKYITKDFGRFEKTDYLHALPSFILIAAFFIFKSLPENQMLSNEVFSSKYLWLQQIYGYLFMFLLVTYVAMAIYKVVKFKRQIKENYSFHSMKISLDWLLVMIFLFVLLILLIIISSALYESGKIDNKVYIIRHMLELFHVYVLSIWGFHQNQLISGLKNDYTVNVENHATGSGKYVKSGLKEEDAKKYIQVLMKFMNESEIWKDPELSIAKLSTKTSIPKHQLSEVLNEYLGKSFYVFVNEYRVEYAKNLFTQKKYDNWSILAIAFECGFNSKTAFNIFFKKYTQFTPSEYKKMLK
jgi:AraC-like DNA-binding protein